MPRTGPVPVFRTRRTLREATLRRWRLSATRCTPACSSLSLHLGLHVRLKRPVQDGPLRCQEGLTIEHTWSSFWYGRRGCQRDFLSQLSHVGGKLNFFFEQRDSLCGWVASTGSPRVERSRLREERVCWGNGGGVLFRKGHGASTVDRLHQNEKQT